MYIGPVDDTDEITTWYPSCLYEVLCFKLAC